MKNERKESKVKSGRERGERSKMGREGGTIEIQEEGVAWQGR